jgi:hypothetical protein
MLGYVTGHLDTNVGNAKSACQLLGQKKDPCPEIEMNILT